MAKKISLAEARTAMETLRQYGAQSYREPSEVEMGAALGKALSHLTYDPRMVMDAACEALEDHNHHFQCAIVKAIRDGNWKRKGNVATIKLPEYMKTFENHVVVTG